MIKIFLLMILCHIIDDFVLQPVCLSKLKQKSWWEENTISKLYENDYIAALIIHALSWSIMILLPIILMNVSVNNFLLGFSVIGNTAVHAIIDDLKANKKVISLVRDQAIHFFQILITYLVLV